MGRLPIAFAFGTFFSLAHGFAQMLRVDAGARDRAIELGLRREPRAHARDVPIHGVGGRLGRTVAVRLGQHQLTIDQLRENPADGIGKG